VCGDAAVDGVAVGLVVDVIGEDTTGVLGAAVGAAGTPGAAGTGSGFAASSGLVAGSTTGAALDSATAAWSLWPLPHAVSRSATVRAAARRRVPDDM
jgi:hypothetical protein